ncbi:MAG: hypothetical protein NTZ49_03260 [Candidatus Parcubacteria bacterium]|nr:hypothetical protein [Candidatus Parcubacteria bacterium]
MGEKITTSKIEEPRSSETQEKLEKNFEIKKQYQEQFNALKDTGVIELLPKSGKYGVYDISGNECPIPSYEEILQRMEVKDALLEKKREQVFTQLLLVPIGTPLSFLIDRARDLIIKKYNQGKLLDLDGNKLWVAEKEDPIYVDGIYENADLSGDLVYYPQKFDKQNHGGKTKGELIAESGSWQVILIKDLPNLKAKSKKHFEADKSPSEYLEEIQTDKQHKGEEFTTPEAWLTYFIQYLQMHNLVIDEYRLFGTRCFNVGAYLKISNSVPLTSWNTFHGGLELTSNISYFRNPANGTRSVVRI